jgi:menaquinone-dependent protoporphyrinogen oxidase
MPLAVFQVSLTSAGEDGAGEAHVLLHQLLDATGADPDVVGLFAGALRYTAYGWVTRRLMRRIAAQRDGDTDVSRDHEYTDWTAVDHFADDVAAMAGAAPR